MFGFYFRTRLFCQNILVRKSDDIIFSKKLCPKQECSEFAPKNFLPKSEHSHFPLKLLVRMWKMANYLKVASSFMKDEVFCSKNSHPHLERSRFTLRD